MLISQIAKYLTAAAVVTFSEDTAGGDCFIEKLPQDPDAAVALIGTGGFRSDSKLGYASPTFQVLVRGAPSDPRAAEAKAQAIYDALHGLRNTTLDDGTWLVSCFGIQSAPVHVERDARDRHLYSLNFLAEIELVTTHSEP